MDETPLMRAQAGSEAQAERLNSNAGGNVYLALSRGEILSSVSAVGPLARVPVSLKDCFDLTGFCTTCGTRFYAENDAPAERDSWIAARLKAAGANIVGKTHLHPLAYGITGENPDYGDCLQPDDATRLTGGSSSGAAASVQEGSAVFAIGTDTGGSIRVPAALCGLAGYRASIDFGTTLGLWAGGVHLAPSFDSIGFLFRDLRDGPALADALFSIGSATVPIHPRIAVVEPRFVEDADPVVLAAFAEAREQLAQRGARLSEIDTGWWHDALEIFAAIQAHEAAAIQRTKLAGRADFSVFGSWIAERLSWGESLPPEHIAAMRGRHATFRARMDALLTEHDFLLLPCAPVHALVAGANHSGARSRILRYTTPVSLAGMPAVTLPFADGAGMQLVAARGNDAALLAYAASVGQPQPGRPQ
jgi:Asp-tRNA(Asn)/Glu-tRNA(Gln) amidotransferase A subunit family amidase